MKTEQYHALSSLTEAPSAMVRPNRPPMAPDKIPEAMKHRMAEDEKKKQERQQWADKFDAGTASFNGLTLPYRYFVPQSTEGETYPLIVFLHGGGECGEDNEAQLLAYDGAIVWVREQLQGTGEKCFVLAMQCPQETGYGWAQRHLLVCGAAMEALIERYPIDEDRIYLTGMSMGGGGCYRFTAMFPELFAAVAPICPAFTDAHFQPIPEAVEEVADVFAALPVWMFHAEDDPVIPVQVSRLMNEALEKRGRKAGQDFFYTEYPAECGHGHGSWDPAFGWPVFRDWLFGQTRNPAAPFGPPPEAPDFDPKWFQTMMEKAEREKAMRREQINRFEAREKITSNITMKYRLFVPKNAEAKSLPLLVCLHGIGECGNDNDAPMTANNMAWDWVEAQDKGLDEPCMILVPQSPLPIPNNIWELPYLQIVAEILDDICAQYPVDQDRLYLTGLSLGGFGAWNLNRLCPNRFAAVVTCCPACLKGSMFHNSIDEECLVACADALSGTPIWMFHAEDDGAVPSEITRRMAQELQKRGRREKTDFHVTIYPAELKLGHGCWERAYKEQAMHQWLFSQRL